MSDVVRPNNHISTIMKEYVKELEFKYQNPGELCGISTGYDCLDYKLDGLKSGEVTIIGGRPAMGKTALAANLSYNIAAGFYFKHQQNPADDKCVVYIGLELAKKRFAERLISIVSEVPTYQMRNNEDVWENFSKIVATSRQLEKLPLNLYATECNVENIITELQKIRQQNEIGCVIIDYLQLLSRDYMEQEDLTGIMIEIKNMAVAFNVPVIVLTQLSRNLEKRADKFPLLCDIRGLYNNLNAVDKVLFLYREYYYIINNEPRKRPKETDEKFQKRHDKWNTLCKETQNFCDVIIAKNSNGYSGRVKMFFEWWTGRFEDWKEEY